MRSKLISAAVFGGLVFAAAPALAWTEKVEWTDKIYIQPANPGVAVWAYPSRKNYCPAGLQPVVMGGAVSCGQPTHVGYHSNNHPKTRRVQKHVVKAKAKPTVAYSKGYVATGKGYDEGYKE